MLRVEGQNSRSQSLDRSADTDSFTHSFRKGTKTEEAEQSTAVCLHRIYLQISNLHFIAQELCRSFNGPPQDTRAFLTKSPGKPCSDLGRSQRSRPLFDDPCHLNLTAFGFGLRFSKTTSTQRNKGLQTVNLDNPLHYLDSRQGTSTVDH